MSLTVEERKERKNRLFPLLLVHFVSHTLCSCLQQGNECDFGEIEPQNGTFKSRPNLVRSGIAFISQQKDLKYFFLKHSFKKKI